MSKKLTLEQFLGSASYYLSEMETAEERDEKEEVTEATDDEGIDDIPAEIGGDEGHDEAGETAEDEAGETPEIEAGEEDAGTEEPIEDDADEDGSEVGDEIEEKEDGDITIKDVANAVKTLAKNLATTQKKISSINFGNMPFQKQQEVLDALRNVYESARGFASEMGTFNSVEWK